MLLLQNIVKLIIRSLFSANNTNANCASVFNSILQKWDKKSLIKLKLNKRQQLPQAMVQVYLKLPQEKFSNEKF